jgi:outer membrane lipoprotein-sorting protein
MKLLLILTTVSWCLVAGALQANSVRANEDLTRQALLLRLKSQFSKIRTYRCTMKLESFGDGYKVQHQLLWYKNPGYVRITQIGPFRKGAVVVIRPEGSIRAHLGGLLSFVTISLHPDDPRLLGVTGDPAQTADYGSIIQAALDAEQTVKRFTIGKGLKDGQPTIILESVMDGPITLYRMIIDPGRMVIIGLERYKQARLISCVSWEGIEVNVDLPNDLFTL